MEAVFYHSYVWVQRHKLFSVIVALLFLLGCGWMAAQIRFEEDITRIIPKNERTNAFSRALQQVDFADKITILLEKGEGATVRNLTELADVMVDSLADDSTYIRSMTTNIGQEEMEGTYDFVYRHLPLFLDGQDYRNLAGRLRPDSLRERVAQNYRTLLSPAGLLMRDVIQKDPLGLTLLGLQKVKQQAVGEQFVLQDGFIMTRDTSRLLLFIDPLFQGADTEHNTVFVDHLNRLRDSLKQRQPNVQISYYGGPVIAVANAKQIKQDISTTVLISMGVLMLLLILFYRKIYIPLLVFIPTLFAVLFALACLYLYKSVISAISLSVAAVLVGITIDYTLHILTHYKQSKNIRELYQELTRPLLMSGATNAVVFLCLLFVHSEALVDLGIFASICIFSSAVFTLLIVPHLYRPKQELRHNSVLDKLAAFPFERNTVLIVLCLILVLISCFTQDRVGYSNNLANLNFVPASLKKVEKKLDALLHTTSKSVYLVATGTSFEAAARQADSLSAYLQGAKSRKEIMDYSGLNLIPLSAKEQEHRMSIWNSFWERQNRETLITDLQTIGEPFGFDPDTHVDFYRLLHERPKGVSWQELQGQRALGVTDFVAERDGFFTISTLVKLGEQQRGAFVEAMQRKPAILLIDRQQLNETFLGQLRDDFNRLVGYSSIGVLLILWLFFRRLELVLLSSIPIALTGLVTAGLMGLFGLEFNIFSAIVCTLVFGHGVDFSIFMTAALQKQYSTGKDSLQTYRTSILLAVLTTVLAIGALVFAKHPALLSIAAVSLIGVFAAVIVTFVFYPILFRFFIADRAKHGKSPFTISILLLSLLFFAYYGIGCLLVSLFGRLLVGLLPLAKERKEELFRRAVASFMKSVLYLHPLTKHKRMNPHGETFSRPAVIIANHSSFLDTLSLGMLVPKGIFLVNDWVWNSPIFGRAVRALGFYPVSQGLAQGMEELRTKVAQGYSLIVFPEGTRSYENVVKRFHKGAFYLAEQLQLDVLPVYLLGNGDVLPKGDMLIFGGALTPIIGARIAPNDTSFGTGYRARTKTIQQCFRQQYGAWRRQEEGPFYFRKKIQLAYYYKDDAILQAVKGSMTRFATDYAALHHKLDDAAQLVHVSDTYGELDYLLSLQSGNRAVLGVIADTEKRAVAESIYWSRQRQVQFAATLTGSYPILLIHPEYTAAALTEAFLEGFTEIYTFRKELVLLDLGWAEQEFSETLMRYYR